MCVPDCFDDQEETGHMGKLHHIFTPAELQKLSPREKTDLQKKMTQQIKNDPMIDAIIKAHGKLRKQLKEKLKK